MAKWKRSTEIKKRATGAKRGAATPELWPTSELRNRWQAIVEAFKTMRDHDQITINPKAFGRTKHAMAILVRKAIADNLDYHGSDVLKPSIRYQKDGTIAVCTSRTFDVGLTGRFPSRGRFRTA